MRIIFSPQRRLIVLTLSRNLNSSLFTRTATALGLGLALALPGQALAQSYSNLSLTYLASDDITVATIPMLETDTGWEGDIDFSTISPFSGLFISAIDDATGDRVILGDDRINPENQLELLSSGSIAEINPFRALQPNELGLRFNVSVEAGSFNYSFERLYQVPSEFQRINEAISINTNGDPLVPEFEMTLIDDFTWQAEVDFSDYLTNHYFSFHVLNFFTPNPPDPVSNFRTPYGDRDATGIAQRYGRSIPTEGHGHYRITLDERDFSYSIERLYLDGSPFARNFEDFTILTYVDYDIEYQSLTLIAPYTWAGILDLNAEFGTPDIRFLAYPFAAGVEVDFKVVGDAYRGTLFPEQSTRPLGDKLFVPAGSYLVYVNTQTQTYELIPHNPQPTF